METQRLDVGRAATLALPRLPVNSEGLAVVASLDERIAAHEHAEMLRPDLDPRGLAFAAAMAARFPPRTPEQALRMVRAYRSWPTEATDEAVAAVLTGFGL